MVDNVPKIIEELLDSGLTQAELAKAVGTSQSNISKWKNGKQRPLTTEWDRVMSFYFERKGDGYSIDRKLAPYDEDTKRIVTEMVDDYLRRLPKPPRR